MPNWSGTNLITEPWVKGLLHTFLVTGGALVELEGAQVVVIEINGKGNSYDHEFLFLDDASRLEEMNREYRAYVERIGGAR